MLYVGKEGVSTSQEAMTYLPRLLMLGLICPLPLIGPGQIDYCKVQGCQDLLYSLERNQNIDVDRGFFNQDQCLLFSEVKAGKTSDVSSSARKEERLA